MKTDKEKFEAWLANVKTNVDKNVDGASATRAWQGFELGALSTWPMIEKLVEAIEKSKCEFPCETGNLCITCEALAEFREGLEK